MQKNAVQTLIVGVAIPSGIVAIALLIYFAMGESKPQQIIQTDNSVEAVLLRIPIVEVAEVMSYDPSQTLDIECNGVVVPFREISLAAEVAGRVVYKNEKCRAGNYCEANELLFKIDDQDYKLDVERLTAQRQSEYSQQQELEQEISNSERLVSVAEQDLEIQDREIKRLLDLPSGYASATELDAASRSRLASVNTVTTLQNQLDLLRTRRTRIELAEKLAISQLEQAKVNLARTEIRAPIAGIIVNENAQTDSFVTRGQTLCTMEDTSCAEVSIDLRTDQLAAILDQNDAGNAKVTEVESVVDSSANQETSVITERISQSYQLPQTPVTIVYRLAGRESTQYQWDGILSRYEGVGVDLQSRTISVRVTVPEPRKVRVVSSESQTHSPDTSNRRLVPALLRGMYVQAVFKTTPSRAMVLVPKLAVRPGGDVWKFSEDKAALKNLVSKNTALTPIGNTKLVGKKGEHSSNAADEKTKDAPEVPADIWNVGRVEVISNVRTVRLVERPDVKAVADQLAKRGLDPSGEFWAIQATETLQPGTQVIITPLAAIMGDGSDIVRFER